MVLHLLGKKSWNVYNKDNVDRVRRDEATAQAREEEEERRMQEEDAIRRTAILRGEAPPPVRQPSPEASSTPRNTPIHDRKRRRLRGEDDTDREIREAKEDADTGTAVRSTLSGTKTPRDKQVAITDHAGHIQLFAAPSEKDILASSRNADAEAEKAKKARQFEDQYTMRFSNAAGFKQGLAAPWYTDGKQERREETTKDAWGNEDPNRKNRQQSRMNTSDPMALMQKAQSRLKQAEIDRVAWKAVKDKELKEVEILQREERRTRKEYRHKHRHRERSRSVDGLEGFSLDASEESYRKDKRRRHDGHDHHTRHRSNSRERGHGSSHRSSHYSHRRRSRSPGVRSENGMTNRTNGTT